MATWHFVKIQVKLIVPKIQYFLGQYIEAREFLI